MSREDIEEVTDYVSAINHAFKEIQPANDVPISVRLFNDCHRILIQGVRGATKQPGEIRRSQNWVGGSRPGNAVFVPPPPERVAGLLGDLEKYIHIEDELAPLLRIALVHAQFETIHPYLDGNARLGRMLIALLLDHELRVNRLLRLRVERAQGEQSHDATREIWVNELCRMLHRTAN